MSSSSSPNAVPVKAVFGDTIRRFSLEPPLTFSGLVSTIRSYFPSAPSDCPVFYTDDDGDSVIISSDPELAEVVRLAHVGILPILRLTLTPKKSASVPTPTPAPTSTPAPASNSSPAPAPAPAPTSSRAVPEGPPVAPEVDALFTGLSTFLGALGSTVGTTAAAAANHAATAARTAAATAAATASAAIPPPMPPFQPHPPPFAHPPPPPSGHHARSAAAPAPPFHPSPPPFAHPPPPPFAGPHAHAHAHAHAHGHGHGHGHGHHPHGHGHHPHGHGHHHHGHHGRRGFGRGQGRRGSWGYGYGPGMGPGPNPFEFMAMFGPMFASLGPLLASCTGISASGTGIFSRIADVSQETRDKFHDAKNSIRGQWETLDRRAMKMAVHELLPRVVTWVDEKRGSEGEIPSSDVEELVTMVRTAFLDILGEDTTDKICVFVRTALADAAVVDTMRALPDELICGIQTQMEGGAPAGPRAWGEEQAGDKRVPDPPLRMGDRGSGVAQLQSVLTEIGYMNRWMYARRMGVFGRRTFDGVAAFQKAYSLEDAAEEGVYDATTAASLMSVLEDNESARNATAGDGAGPSQTEGAAATEAVPEGQVNA